MDSFDYALQLGDRLFHDIGALSHEVLSADPARIPDLHVKTECIRGLAQALAFVTESVIHVRDMREGA